MYSLDISTKSWTKSYVPEPDAEIPVLPELVGVDKSRWCRDHMDEGFVYMLGWLPNKEALYLFDHDRDGEVDAEGPLTIEQFRDKKLDRADRYFAFF